MCGIAGLIKFPDERRTAPPISPGDATLQNVLSKIAHRGPDGQSIWTDPRPGRQVALLHSRLAILDLAGGRQPMGNEDGSVHVIFNGEIYNHLELRAQLIAAGHHFSGDHSDTEVLVHGWEEWGEQLPKRLVGMFAFAVWDAPHDTLFLARDRMGQKPLFYCVQEDGIAFSSAIPALLAFPDVPRRVPVEQLATYLFWGYIPAPATIYRDISQLSPGHTLLVARDLVRGGPYFSIHEIPAAPAAPLRQQLAAAVESQLVADVPVTCFLSGGIDSSIIAALGQQSRRRQNLPPLATLCVSFAEPDFDESAYARRVAERLGTQHHEVQVQCDAAVPDVLAEIMRLTLGQPFADSSILPSWHVSRAARAIAPVTLSGDGGDELFGGYDRYRAAQMLTRLRPAMRMAAKMGSSERLRRIAAAARESNVPQQYAAMQALFSTDDIGALLGNKSLIIEYPQPAPLATISAARWAMLFDQGHYLPGDVLWKVDSASMFHALEVRSPFLDHRVVQIANALPTAALFRRGRGKAVLRRDFGDLLPSETLTRKKQGFGVPVGDWFRGLLREFLMENLTRPDGFCKTYFAAAPVRELLDDHMRSRRDHTHRLFALLMLELWHDAFPSTIEDAVEA